MNLQLPIRSIRTEPSLENSEYAYFDHEVVVQPDGRRAVFTDNNKDRALGWQFVGWRDEQGFWLLEGDNQVGEYAQTLLDSTEEKNRARHEAWLEKEAAKPKHSPEEILARFRTFSFPVIASMANAPILSELVAVQPMTVPVGSPAIKALPLEIGELRGRRKGPSVGVEEELHAYKYGGIMAERGGWFVTKKGDLTRVLRYRQDWMS